MQMYYTSGSIFTMSKHAKLQCYKQVGKQKVSVWIKVNTINGC